MNCPKCSREMVMYDIFSGPESICNFVCTNCGSKTDEYSSKLDKSEWSDSKPRFGIDWNNGNSIHELRKKINKYIR